MTKKWWTGLLALVLVAVALASCSSGSKSGSSKKVGSCGGSGSSLGPVTGKKLISYETSAGSQATTRTRQASTSIRIVSQDFGENKTLAQVYGKYLTSKGFNVTIQDPISTRTQIYKTMAANKSDLVIDYAGSATSELDPTVKSSPDPATTYQHLTAALKSSTKDDLKAGDLEAAKIAPAQDANALVATTKWAKANDVTKISDLKSIECHVAFGGSPDCSERADCLKGYENPSIYGLKFKSTKTLTYGPALVQGLVSNAVQVAQYQTTGPEISTGQLVVLKDDKGMLSADPIVPIYRSAVASDKLTSALNALSPKITTKDLSAWNKSTDIDKDEPSDVAKKWLQDNNLGS